MANPVRPFRFEVGEKAYHFRNRCEVLSLSRSEFGSNLAEIREPGLSVRPELQVITVFESELTRRPS